MRAFGSLVILLVFYGEICALSAGISQAISRALLHVAAQS